LQPKSTGYANAAIAKNSASSHAARGAGRRRRALGLEHGAPRGIGIRERAAERQNLDNYTPLRIGDVPEVEVEFLPSTEMPTGLGEPATTVVAPAIGNAIFAAVGIRVRHLPIRSEAIAAALYTRN
jgi:hypothetical protein